jgi:hypothetical protein
MDSRQIQVFSDYLRNFFYGILDNSVTKSTNSVTKTHHSGTKNLRKLAVRWMKITFAEVAHRSARSKSEATDRLLADYVSTWRAARFQIIRCDSQLLCVSPQKCEGE